MRHLLSHQLPLRNDDLADRTSYQQAVPASDYPSLLATSQLRDPGFCYDNLGYLVYAAALETTTGTSWKQWLKRELCDPLMLASTSASREDFAPSSLACRNKWEEGRWRSYPPKPDALMHAAGGLLTTTDDLARWMQANLRLSGPEMPATVFAAAHSPIVAADAQDGPIHWIAYGLGQQLGMIGRVPVIGHRGGYEGARSITIFSIEWQIGLALAFSADFRTREQIDRLVGLFFSSLAS